MKCLMYFVFLSCSLLCAKNIQNNSFNNSDQEVCETSTTIDLAGKKDPPPSWTCPICGQTFEKPVVHKCPPS